MQLRRRELLDRFVRWAAQRPGRGGGRGEPTPAQVRDAPALDASVARWADATERAAFGVAPVDAEAQDAVDRLAPGSVAPASGDVTEHAAVASDHVDGARRRSV
jgi:hypothetical protein